MTGIVNSETDVEPIRLEDNPTMMLALIDLLYMGREQDIPS